MFKSKGNALSVIAAFVATAAALKDTNLHPALVLSTASGMAYLALLAINSVSFASPQKPVSRSARSRKVSA